MCKSSAWKNADLPDYQVQQNCGCLSAGTRVPAASGSLWQSWPPSLQGHLQPLWSALGSAVCGLLPRDACLNSSSATINEAWQHLLALPWWGKACAVYNLHHLCWSIGPVLVVSSARGTKGRLAVSPKAKLHPFLSDLANGSCFLGSVFASGPLWVTSSWVSPFYRCSTPNLTQPFSWDHASAE